MPDIFLSYNREDQAAAKLFAEGFEAAGLDVWWDQALRSGEAYDKVTEAALRGAKAVVVLWSPRSADSRWVRAEASIADEKGTLIPAKIAACDLPVMFRLTQTADLSGWEGTADDKAWLAFLGDVRRMVGVTAAKTAEASPGSGSAAGAGSMPNVALVPIEHRGDDEELEFLAEDLTDEVTRELARSRYFKVVAARTMVAWLGKAINHRSLGKEVDARYLIEGKLQRTGENVRLTTQLIEAATGNMLLSSRFVCAMDDLAVGPEDFAITVAAQLYEHVMQEERNRAMALSGLISGWDHMLRAMAFAIRSGLEQARSAVEEARLAVAAAPDLGLAHAWFAFAQEVVGRLFSIHDESRIRQTHAHIQQAMQLDGDNPAVLSLLAQTYGQMEDGETALRLALRATGLHPNSLDAQFALAGAYFAMGRVIEVIAASEKYIRLSPPDAVPPMVLQQRGLCLCLDGRPDEAEPVLDRTLALNPQFGPTLRWKAIAAAQQSKEGAAHEAMARLRQAEPGLSGEEHVRNMQRVPAMVPHMTEAIATFRRLWDETGGDGCRP